MNTSEILIYQAADGKIKIYVRLEDETVWLTQDHMAGLFGKSKKTISEHIRNIFSEGELDEQVVVRNFRTTTRHGAMPERCRHLTACGLPKNRSLGGDGMTPSAYTEDTLVQQTTAEYLEQEPGWQSVYAYNTEVFLQNPHPGPLPEGGGVQLPDGKVCLGRTSDRDVVLSRPLRAKLVALNPGLPDAAYDDAVRQIVATVATQSLVVTNREKYNFIRDGVQVAFRNAKGDRERRRLRVFDFAEPTNNDFLCVRELWVRGDLYRRRADIVGFVNGLPLLFMELKNVSKDIRAAYAHNFKDYKDTVPHLFHHNAFVVLAYGVDAKLGSVTSRFEHFHEWKRLAEEQPGAVDMETLLKGFCEKTNFIDGNSNAAGPSAPACRTSNMPSRRRLQRLLQQNPLRTNFQRLYEQIVAEYNREKDRVTIEQTFEDLLRFVNEMTEEESRAGGSR